MKVKLVAGKMQDPQILIVQKSFWRYVVYAVYRQIENRQISQIVKGTYTNLAYGIHRKI